MKFRKKITKKEKIFPSPFPLFKKISVGETDLCSKSSHRHLSSYFPKVLNFYYLKKIKKFQDPLSVERR